MSHPTPNIVVETWKPDEAQAPDAWKTIIVEDHRSKLSPAILQMQRKAHACWLQSQNSRQDTLSACVEMPKGQTSDTSLQLDGIHGRFTGWDTNTVAEVDSLVCDVVNTAMGAHSGTGTCELPFDLIRKIAANPYLSPVTPTLQNPNHGVYRKIERLKNHWASIYPQLLMDTWKPRQESFLDSIKEGNGPYVAGFNHVVGLSETFAELNQTTPLPNLIKDGLRDSNIAVRLVFTDRTCFQSLSFATS